MLKHINMKKQLIFISVLAIFITAVLGMRFMVEGSEDAWICENGRWVRHGNPSGEMPVNGCGRKLYMNGQAITWSEAEEIIRNCELKSIFQAHSLRVNIELKSGIKVKTTEPRIDEVFKILSASKCKNVLMATE